LHPAQERKCLGQHIYLRSDDAKEICYRMCTQKLLQEGSNPFLLLDLFVHLCNDMVHLGWHPSQLSITAALSRAANVQNNDVNMCLQAPKSALTCSITLLQPCQASKQNVSHAECSQGEDKFSEPIKSLTLPCSFVHSRAVVNSKASKIRLQLWDVGSLEPKMQTASLASVSEHVEFAALIGKHADVGFVSTSLHLFRRETKFRKSYGFGGPNLNR
jgi:hypothetical protein